MLLLISIIISFLSSTQSIHQSSLLSLLSCTTSSGISLSSLTHSEKDPDYSFTVSESEKYYANICADTIARCVGSSKAPIFYKFDLGITDCSQLGLLNTAVWTGNNVAFSQGDQCGTGSTTLYSSNISFVCGKTNGIIAASGLASCSISITFETPLLCSNPASSSVNGSDTGAIVFIALLFGSLGLYFVGGILYNYSIRTENDTYSDFIPNKVFWTSLPSLIYDGNIYFIYISKVIIHKCGLLNEAPTLTLSDTITSTSNSNKGYGTI